MYILLLLSEWSRCLGGRDFSKVESPVSCDHRTGLEMGVETDKWQGMLREKGFLSLMICQGLAQSPFTYLITDERLTNLAFLAEDGHFFFLQCLVPVAGKDRSSFLDLQRLLPPAPTHTHANLSGKLQYNILLSS